MYIFVYYILRFLHREGDTIILPPTDQRYIFIKKNRLESLPRVVARR